MPVPFAVALAIGFAIVIIGYALAPKPKQPRPPSVEDLDEPTADAGRPVIVLFGSSDIKGLNLLHFGDKGIDTRTVSSDKK